MRLPCSARSNELRVNAFCAPPTVWRILIESDLGAKPDGLREILGAGEPLNPDVIAQVERASGFTVRDGDGQPRPHCRSAIRPASP